MRIKNAWMKRLSKAMAAIFCASMLLLPVSRTLRAESFPNMNEAGEGFAPLSSSTALQSERSAQLKEYNFYYNGTRWVQGWLQCDAGRDVMIFGSGRGKTVRYESFLKRQPMQKSVLNLYTKEEPDCGMMKCYYTLVASGKTVAVRESHYKDEEASWTNQYSITISSGKGRTLPEQECRWLERTRLAVITERRSIYVTESETGDLQYQSYNYQNADATPSLTLKGGTRSADTRKGTETFTFQNRDYFYVLNVSTLESRPFVEVLVKKKGATVQQERPLSYTYLKK